VDYCLFVGIICADLWGINKDMGSQRTFVFPSNTLDHVRALINSKVVTILIVIVTMLVLAYQFTHLTRFPSVFIDEPWYANSAWNWLKNGVNYDSMHAGTRENVIWPFIGNVPMVVSFALLGLGLFQARLVSWIFGVILVVLTVLVGRKSFSNLSGLLAGLLLSLSQAFIQASHYARPDIMLAAVGMLSYLISLIAFEKNRWWAHLLAGLFIGLSFDIHQNAILYALGLSVLYLYHYGWKVLSKPGTWLFVIGGSIGVIYYLLVYVLPNPEGFLNYYKFSLGISHPMPLLTFNLLDWLSSLRAEIGRYHFAENSIDFVILGTSMVYLALRRSKQNWSILIFTVTVFLGFVFLIGNKHDIYAILLYPYFMLIVGAALVGLAKESQKLDAQKAFSLVLTGLIIISGIYRLNRSTNENRDYDYYAITQKIETVISPDDSVMGLPNWWLGLSKYHYQSSLGLTYLHLIEGKSLEQGLEQMKPDIIILDDGLQGLLVDDGYYIHKGFDFFKLPKKEFGDMLISHGTLALEFSNPWHGWFYIYKMSWDN
jgi:4-amino-4-deoxy-L-arabinose transferase-like glycosyltransferase